MARSPTWDGPKPLLPAFPFHPIQQFCKARKSRYWKSQYRMEKTPPPETWPYIHKWIFTGGERYRASTNAFIFAFWRKGLALKWISTQIWPVLFPAVSKKLFKLCTDLQILPQMMAKHRNKTLNLHERDIKTGSKLTFRHQISKYQRMAQS